VKFEAAAEKAKIAEVKKAKIAEVEKAKIGTGKLKIEAERIRQDFELRKMERWKWSMICDSEKYRSMWNKMVVVLEGYPVVIVAIRLP